MCCFLFANDDVKLVQCASCVFVCRSASSFVARDIIVAVALGVSTASECDERSEGSLPQVDLKTNSELGVRFQ